MTEERDQTIEGRGIQDEIQGGIQGGIRMPIIRAWLIFSCICEAIIKAFNGICKSIQFGRIVHTKRRHTNKALEIEMRLERKQLIAKNVSNAGMAEPVSIMYIQALRTHNPVGEPQCQYDRFKLSILVPWYFTLSKALHLHLREAP
jgi:hypothetical protein